MSPPSLLAIVGEPTAFSGIVEWFRKQTMTVQIAGTAKDGIAAHRDRGADMIIVGLPLHDATATTVIGALFQQDPSAVIVVVGADAEIASREQALALGASGYAFDPVEGRNELMFALGMSLGVRRTDAQFRSSRAHEAARSEWPAIIARCAGMKQAVMQLQRICGRTLSGAAPTVLLSGEVGTGKRLLARSLHYNSARRDRPFVHINCSSPELGLQLFGEGARQGAFELASGGTLFLEEVGAVPPAFQYQLLTTVEDRIVYRLDNPHPIRVDVQVVASTRRDLGAMTKVGEMSAELYHRLSVITVDLPPLRERGEDIVALAEHLLATIAVEYGLVPPTLSDGARAALMRYPWRGNIRELANEMERILFLVDSDIIEAAHVSLHDKSSAIAISHADAKIGVSISGELCPLEELEREVIREALLRSNGNVSSAARFLSITRQTMLYRMKKHGFASPTNPDFAAEQRDKS